MIFISGGAGYIGSHVNKRLSQRGRPTVVFDSLISGRRDFVKWGEFFQGDLADKNQICACFERYPVEAVIHLSAFGYAGESVIHPAEYYRNNVANTLNLLEIMREFQVRLFVFSSSCAVYGIPSTLPLTEDHPRIPVNPYGRTKQMVEDILRDYDHAYGLKHISLRYFNAAGADPDGELGESHDPETHLIPLAIYAAMGLNPGMTIFGTDYPTEDGTCVRDYIHATDLAEAHLDALEYLASTGRSAAFNLGNEKGFSVREVLETVKRVGGKDLKIKESSRRPGDPPILVSDCRKAKNLLRWAPGYGDLRMIIETAWNWHSR